MVQTCGKMCKCTNDAKKNNNIILPNSVVNNRAYQVPPGGSLSSL